MAGLLQQIQDDLKTALKNKAQAELAALRLLKSDLQYEMTKTGADTMPDDKVQAVIKTAVKKRKDAIEEFTKGNRADKADAEKAEMEILERYLPAAVGEDVIKSAIDEIIEKVKPEGPKDMGKVMGQVMARFKGQNIDGKLVNKLVSERLKG